MKRLRYNVLLTDIINNKKVIIKKTNKVEEVEKWLATKNEYPDRDWEYEYSKPIVFSNDEGDDKSWM